MRNLYEGKRHILTQYFKTLTSKEVVAQTRSSLVDEAVVRCQLNMRQQKYDARCAVVHDSRRGKDYASVSFSLDKTDATTIYNERPKKQNGKAI